MKPLRVGVWQFEPAAGEPLENLELLKAALESPPARGLQLLVAPEVFLTGWDPQQFATKEFAQQTWVRMVGDVAKKARIWLASSLFTGDARRRFNTFHLWDPDGKVVGTQHKIHRWAQEKDRLQAGDEPRVIRSDIGNVGGVVCYDVEFPEVSRALALQGAELLITPAAFYTPSSWDLMTRARALENGCFLAAANQIGGDPTNPHNGQSRIVDPFGNVLAEVPTKTTGIAVAHLDPTRIEAARRWAPFLRDLRLGPQARLATR